MPPERSNGEAKPEQGEVKAFLDEPATHQRVKEWWRPYLEAKLGFRNHWYPAVSDYTGLTCASSNGVNSPVNIIAGFKN